MAAAAGAGAERIDLSGSELKSDPARLADEAASISMFGGGRYIVVDPAGEESIEAVAALIGAPAAGNPVALISGNLKPSSALLKLVLASPAALAFASYLPDARDWDRMVSEIARGYGLQVRPDVAQRIAEAAGGNRAIVSQELGKFAAYLDADPTRPTTVDHDTIDAVGAAHEEGDPGLLVGHVFDGNARLAQNELQRLHAVGAEGITLLRAALRRALLLSRLRGRVEQGEAPAAVVAAQGKSMFWKEKDGVERQLRAWPAERLARCVTRLAEAERGLKRAGALGTVAADAELLEIARQAGRRN
jgi:DNA polymerase-3 subunit delta